MEMLSLPWGTYDGMREQNMVGTCRSEYSQPTAVFNIVIVKMDT